MACVAKIAAWRSPGRTASFSGRVIARLLRLSPVSKTLPPSLLGDRHALALTHGGQVFAWGANDRKQLGVEGDDAEIPVLVSDLDSVESIAAGSDTSLAVVEDGTVRSWGANDEGQLGIGSFKDSEVPTAIQGLTGIVGVATTGNRTALVGDDGELWLSGEGQDRPRHIESPGESVKVQLSGDLTIAANSAGGLWASSSARHQGHLRRRHLA